jgi:hydrogenase nickel incorporation protein HypB
MCGVCGCDQATVDGRPAPPAHGHHHHDHDHDHAHDHDHDHDHDHARDPSGETRRVSVERDILAENDRLAAINRASFESRGVFVLNLLSAPGSGKTTLLTRTITDLKDTLPITVIEGDQQTDLDAARIRATGVPAVQVNTGKGCHLDATMVARASATLAPSPGSLLVIENVGNLVCPAAFDLGEARRVVIVSVTEGEDKPLKYPDMFHGADLMVINKIDLLPYVSFDVARCVRLARQINPGLTAFSVSATAGTGLSAWYDWIQAHRHASAPAGGVGAA